MRKRPANFGRNANEDSLRKERKELVMARLDVNVNVKSKKNKSCSRCGERELTELTSCGKNAKCGVLQESKPATHV